MAAALRSGGRAAARPCRCVLCRARRASPARRRPGRDRAQARGGTRRARGFARCSARPKRSSRRRASCWSSCGSSSSSARSRSRSSRGIDRAPAGDVASAARRLRARAERCARSPTPIGPTSKPGSCSSTSSGRAGYWRLLLDVDDLQSIGRAYRTAAAMTHLDRERIQSHQRTLEALADERATLQARSQELAKLEDAGYAARARRSIARSQAGTRARRVDRRAAGSECAAGRASSRRRSSACRHRWLTALDAGRGASPAAAVPGRPALAGARDRQLAVRPSAEQPVRHRPLSATASRSAVPRDSR